jgi:hypothetical protein
MDMLSHAFLPAARVSTDSGNDHSPRVARHLYDKIRHDVAVRKEVAERIDSGFELPSNNVAVGPNGPKIKSEPVLEMGARV